MSQYDNTDRGVLFKNDRKDSDSHPDYKGSVNVGGVDFWLSAWIKTSDAKGKYMSLSVKPKDRAQSQPAAQKQTHGEMKAARRPPPPKSSTGFDDMDDSIPF
jgi:uncharacterized protein (DUF736 family)